MQGASILPVSIRNNELYFLFGKENPMEDSHKGFSDFGGGIEKNETAFNTATREGAEETTFFFGNQENVKKIIKKAGGFYKMVYINDKIQNNVYNVHLFYMDYDENLPKYYNNCHKELWNKMDKKYLNNTKFFEKIEIKWFSVKELKKNRHLFREFYKKIVDEIIKELPEITKFIKNKKNKTRTITRKYKNKSRKYSKNI